MKVCFVIIMRVTKPMIYPCILSDSTSHFHNVFSIGCALHSESNERSISTTVNSQSQVHENTSGLRYPTAAEATPIKSIIKSAKEDLENDRVLYNKETFY